jgi:DNA topoisomerase-6 subunit B
MGISAAGMYGQLTVGKPLHIISRVEGEALASELFVSIDTANNRPDIHKKKRIAWSRPHGTRVEMEIEGVNQGGPHSVEAYLKLTAITNPHVSIIYRGPRGKELFFARSCKELPPRPKEIKPHPSGVELGRLIQMLNGAKSRSLLQFLVDEFSCVGQKTAREIISLAGKPLSERSYPAHIAHAQATALHRALQKTRVQKPHTDCIVPIGEAQLLEGLRKELPADFYTVATRPPASYRGNPFQVEVAIAFGRPGETEIDVDAFGHMRMKKPEDAEAAQHLIARKDEPVRLLRFANRVPLLYQQSSCAITKSVLQTNWRAYGLHQPKGALPIAPMAILVHVASVWVPYTSEAKEAVEPYPELVREIKLGLQECARRLSHYLQRERALQHEYERRSYIEKYLPHIGLALQDILSLDDETRDAMVMRLDDTLHASRAAKRPAS